MALSSNIWWTRKARIRAEKRLLSNAFQSQLLLLWYSFFSVAVSIYYLNDTQSELGATYWVVYSVLVLVMSCFINGLSFKERAGLIKECYIGLKSLHLKAEHNEGNGNDQIKLSIISNDYEQSLNACENHTDEDYIVALCNDYWSSSRTTTTATDTTAKYITQEPTFYQKVQFFFYYIKRFLVLSILYALPIIIMCLLKP
ncbi:SLATT domain-containing protein [Shewanella sp. Scap07]|uniref:SLATT domain-containing protein n=1 Tax=Shewanella sp. Scap07 TaxID=2589987 RepID=UPI001C4BA8EE|nr:SLATT domain-containing protein [Shewanella sp. Scap07]